MSDCCIQDAKVTSCYPELLTQELCPAGRRTSSRSLWKTLTKASCTKRPGCEEEEKDKAHLMVVRRCFTAALSGEDARSVEWRRRTRQRQGSHGRRARFWYNNANIAAFSSPVQMLKYTKANTATADCSRDRGRDFM